ATFVMRQAFLTMPADFEDAAAIDGSGRWRTMLQIYLPLARPSLASVVVLACWYSWNQFLEPLIYLRSPEKLTVPVALTHYEDPIAGPLWGVQMAATTLSVIPVLLVFFFAQRHVVAGLTAGGLKSWSLPTREESNAGPVLRSATPRLLAIHSEVGAADVRNNHSRSGARRARRGRAAQGAVPLALDSGVEPPVGGWPRRDPAPRAAPAARPRS